MFSVCHDFEARVSPADKKPAAFKRHRNERSHRNGGKLRNRTEIAEKGEKRGELADDRTNNSRQSGPLSLLGIGKQVINIFAV